ncbi:Uncharacterized protein QTN25_006322 [Entamoeba marina]
MVALFYTNHPSTIPLNPFIPTLIPSFQISSHKQICSDDTMEDSSTDGFDFHQIDDFDDESSLSDDNIEYSQHIDILETTNSQDINNTKCINNEPKSFEITKDSSSSYVPPYQLFSDDSSIENLEKRIKEDLTTKHKKDKKKSHQKRCEERRKLPFVKNKKRKIKKSSNQLYLNLFKISVVVAIVAVLVGLGWKSHMEMLDI